MSMVRSKLKGTIMKMMKMLMMSLLLLSGLTVGCAVNQSDIRGFNLISVDEEKQLGQKFVTEVEKQQTVLKDPVLQNYVDRVGRRLLTGVDVVEFDYTFKVVKDDNINAFA